MREIRFRQWDQVEKRMTYNAGIELKPLGYDLNGQPVYPHIMQFTGLLDRSGKEIYEGDVYEWNDKSRGVVKWVEDGSTGFEPFNDSYSDYGMTEGKEVTVIGNIYENPDLLKEG